MPVPLDPSLYALLVDRVQDYAIFLIDPKGYILSWNRGATNIKQYAAAEIIGKHFSTFYTPDDIARNWPSFELERATREGRFEDEGWRVRKDGSRFWANVIITALRDDSGKLLAFSKITRDVSERKRQEESLRQSEERFRLLVEGVQDYAIYLLSPEGLVTSWNNGARRIKGYEASEVIGTHYSRFYLPEDIEAGKPWTELAVARERGRGEDEGWRVRKDGSIFWARVVVTALHDSDGELRGFAKVTQDMTQQRHSESLETSASNLNNFIAVLAHELRNPLAPIRNAVHLQRRMSPDDPAQETARAIIDRQSAQLTRIVDDLLDINRITRGALAMEMKPCDVNAVVDRAVETLRPAIDAASQALTIELSPQKIEVLGDELRLTQALTNILSNANRYTEAGGSITLRVSAAPQERKARISVRDTGQGIDPHFISSIFGMFVHGKDPLNRPAKGLGVGLALTRSIVELHHGTVEARSAGVGKGSEFVIELPILVDTPVAPPQAKRPVLAERRGTGSRHRILVVDDNADAAAVLTTLLRKQGHEVMAFNDGAEAIRTFDAFRPEIVLLDIGMPGMNGLEVARMIRERERSPRPFVVAVTGWAMPEDKERTREAGFDRHLVKPVEESDLADVVAAYERSVRGQTVTPR